MKPYTLAEAEAEARAAIDAGDAETLARLEPLIDQLEIGERRPEATLQQAALYYAQQGVPVFPLQPGRKAPLGKCSSCKGDDCTNPQSCGHELCHGFKDATTDVATVTAWWDVDPRRNIGIPTGHRFDAVDIDGPLGQKSRAEHWETIFGQVDADCIAKILTPRPGGMHLWVPPTGDGNSTHIVPGVDYRGAGGYVVAPPSVIAPGGKDHPGKYAFLGTPLLFASVTGAA